MTNGKTRSFDLRLAVFAPIAFLLGAIADKSGYIPFSLEQLTIGYFVILVGFGAIAVITVLISIARFDRRWKKRTQNAS